MHQRTREASKVPVTTIHDKIRLSLFFFFFFFFSHILRPATRFSNIDSSMINPIFARCSQTRDHAVFMEVQGANFTSVYGHSVGYSRAATNCDSDTALLVRLHIG